MHSVYLRDKVLWSGIKLLHFVGLHLSILSSLSQGQRAFLMAWTHNLLLFLANACDRRRILNICRWCFCRLQFIAQKLPDPSLFCVVNACVSVMALWRNPSIYNEPFFHRTEETCRTKTAYNSAREESTAFCYDIAVDLTRRTFVPNRRTLMVTSEALFCPHSQIVRQIMTKWSF